MNYLDTNNLPKDFSELGFSENNETRVIKLYTILNEHTLYFLMKKAIPQRTSTGHLRITPEPGFYLNQFEIPIAALPWLVDTIENKFWKKASDGGLPGDVLHVDKVVEEEDLRIRFSPNCGAEGVPGFKFENYSRKEDEQNWQEIQVPYSLLRKGGLLQSWKDIAFKYERGEL